MEPGEQLRCLARLHGLRSDEVRDCYRRLLAGNPDDAESLRNLGEILSDQGEAEEAIACFEKSLPPEAVLYVCPQTLFKFHPDYDSLFAAILQRDPRGVLVLIAGREKNWSRLLRRRFSASFGTALARVIFLAVMPHPYFLALCKVADAVLDTPGFTGGKITLDCFAMGVPIVTLPGSFMRGRLTLAQYRLLGIDDCIAGNRQEFVDLAIKLAHDREWKREIAERILSRSRVLIENPAAVREVEDFFRQAVAQRGNGAI